MADLMKTKNRHGFKVKSVVEQVIKPGYTLQKEIVDDTDFGGDGAMEMESCYSLYSGLYMGSPKMAKFLCEKMGIREIQPRTSNSNICSIGFNEAEQKWYGWSHRAICGFGIGDKIFNRKYGDENTKWNKRGKVTIRNLSEAKQAAKSFAKYVS